MNKQQITPPRTRIISGDMQKPFGSCDRASGALCPQKHTSSTTYAQDDNHFAYWLKRNSYYHTQVKNFYRFAVPEGSSVVLINANNGYLLDALKPSVGVGIDADAASIEQARSLYPQYQFHAGGVEDFVTDQAFDYVVVSLATMESDDILKMLQSIMRLCHTRTRVMIETYSYIWEPSLWLTQKLGLRRPTQLKNWMSQDDLAGFLHLAGFDVVTQHAYTLLPINIPFVSALVNRFIAPLPLINKLCLNDVVIARPAPLAVREDDYSVSVIITVRNERGNVESAVTRCPVMGKWTELIFVEGHSKDGTLQELHRVAALYPERNITVLVQDGNGKGDAVRKGFAHAKGDVLMILDGDLTTPPEDMPKFFSALVQGRGDFINGSRLIYGMEDKAMRFLNLLANYGFGILFSWLLGQRLKDTLCGTKVLFRRDYEEIARNRHYFGNFDPFGDFDLLFGAAKLHMKIVDMPVHYKNRTYGKTQIHRFRHGAILIWMSLLALWKLKVRR